VVDCSGLVKWLYAQIGLWLPRRAIQQRDYGRPITPHRPIAGDLIFASGANDYYDHNPADGVGHVGLATGDDTVIHVTSGTNVIEVPLLEYVEETRFRGIRRYLLTDTETLTLQVPEGLEIETVDDIRWIILQSLPY
jgi:cell wall-associated NlpC family hydrolase